MVIEPLLPVNLCLGLWKRDDLRWESQKIIETSSAEADSNICVTLAGQTLFVFGKGTTRFIQELIKEVRQGINPGHFN